MLRAWLAARWRPLLVVLGLGLLVRLGVMALYSTAVYHYFGGDSSRYLRLDFTGYSGLFGDPGMTAGYPAFLDLMQSLSSQLAVTIAVQHLFGLITAVLLYATLVRAGAPRGVALVPAAVVSLSGDHVFLEHAVLTEALWTVLLAGGLYCTVRALSSPRALRWLAAAGALLALAAIVRHVALLLPIVIVAWLLLEFGPGRRRRLVAVAALSLPFLVLVGAYVGAARIADGYHGFTELSGFNQYGRVAQFADCRQFTPPEGTRVLCETTPPERRPGPFFYQFSPDSPSVRAGLRNTPESAAVLGRFGRAALLGQPLDYAKAALKDVVRYAVPEVGAERAASGSSPRQMSFGWTLPTQQAETREQIAAHYAEAYGGVSQTLPGTGRLAVLEAYQEVFRPHGLELLLATVIAALGAIAGRGRARLVTVLLLAVAVYLFVVPAALNSYEARYAVPPSAFLAAAAAIGGWTAFRRRFRQAQG